MAPCTSCLVLRSSNCCSQHFCDVCKYMFRMDQGNGHNNPCSNCVFKVYAFCHHCSTVHEVPHRLGSTMLCLSNSSLSNTSHHSLVHPHPMAVNNDWYSKVAHIWFFFGSYLRFFACSTVAHLSHYSDSFSHCTGSF